MCQCHKIWRRTVLPALLAKKLQILSLSLFGPHACLHPYTFTHPYAHPCTYLYTRPIHIGMSIYTPILVQFYDILSIAKWVVICSGDSREGFKITFLLEIALLVVLFASVTRLGDFFIVLGDKFCWKSNQNISSLFELL